MVMKKAAIIYDRNKDYYLTNIGELVSTEKYNILVNDFSLRAAKGKSCAVVKYLYSGAYSEEEMFFYLFLHGNVYQGELVNVGEIVFKSLPNTRLLGHWKIVFHIGKSIVSVRLATPN